jgi:hypothetical protein
MSNYVKTTDFAVKDGLPSGDTNKKVRGLEIDNEFEAIETAIATKLDSSSGALSGTPTAPTAAASNDTTQIATTAHVKLAVALAFQGMIVLWSGAQGAIPTGWVLCDGANGTPDLRDRFVVGAGSSYAVGNAGGAISKSTDSQGSHSHGSVTGSTGLTEAQMPKHYHLMVGPNSITAPQGMGGGYGIYGGGTPDDTAVNYGTWSTGGGAASGSASTGTSDGNGHTHTIAGDGAHTHSITDVRPPYYALCYIMKT